MVKLQMQSALRRFSTMMYVLPLALLLAGCGFWEHKSAPPAAVTQHLTNYAGDGYALGYPTGWVARRSGNVVIFSDAAGLSTLIVEYVANAHGELSAASAVDGGLSGFQGEAKNYQKASIPATMMVGGESWKQGAATGQAAYKGQQVDMKFVVLADNHQLRSPSARTFVIIYGTDNRLFDDASRSAFLPMLQSFKFK